MFALGLLICCLYNKGQPLLDTGNDYSAYRRGIKDVSWHCDCLDSWWIYYGFGYHKILMFTRCSTFPSSRSAKPFDSNIRKACFSLWMQMRSNNTNNNARVKLPPLVILLLCFMHLTETIRLAYVPSKQCTKIEISSGHCYAPMHA